MTIRRQLVRDGLIVSALIALSYLAGWFAFGVRFETSRQIDFDFSKPYVIPLGYETIHTMPSPATASFVTGERIDIFVERSDSIDPLMLDLIVTTQTKANFGMLLPYGGRELLAHARHSGWRLIYRRSIAPADPITITQHGG